MISSPGVLLAACPVSLFFGVDFDQLLEALVKVIVKPHDRYMLQSSSQESRGADNRRALKLSERDSKTRLRASGPGYRIK